jgi:PadR family transcriptional regulator PadR
VLLGVLARAKEPLYGYLISKQIESGETEMLKQGALYPVLRSLERGGLVQSSVKPSVSGPPRRYYRITDRGQAVLEEWTALWRRSRDFVDAILEGNVHV